MFARFIFPENITLGTNPNKNNLRELLDEGISVYSLNICNLLIKKLIFKVDFNYFIYILKHNKLKIKIYGK